MLKYLLNLGHFIQIKLINDYEYMETNIEDMKKFKWEIVFVLSQNTYSGNELWEYDSGYQEFL